MESTLIYPYCGEYIPMFHCCNHYAIDHVVSLRGTGYENKDAGEANLLSSQSIFVETDFEKCLASSDTLLITEEEKSEKVLAKAIEAMEFAGRQKKKVICAMELNDEVLAHVRSVCSDFLYLPEQACEYLDIESQGLKKINTPVVFVGGLFGDTEEFAVLCRLTEYFRKKNFRVSGIGCSTYCELLDLHTMPRFMQAGRSKTDNDRVIMFNHFLAQIEREEKPDIIFVQLPYGMMKFDDYTPNTFGIMAYIIAQSVCPDYFVCCSFYDRFPPEFWSAISTFIQGRFGFQLDCVHMTNLALFYPDILEEQKLSTYRIPLSKVNEVINDNMGDGNIPVVNALTDEGLCLLAKHIENSLLQE